jgi:ABC-type antimicrobial peptide transport system permease subunit
MAYITIPSNDGLINEVKSERKEKENHAFFIILAISVAVLAISVVHLMIAETTRICCTTSLLLVAAFTRDISHSDKEWRYTARDEEKKAQETVSPYRFRVPG